MEGNSSTSRICDDRRGLVQGKTDTDSYLRRGSSPGSRVSAIGDDNFCTGNVQAVVTSDLLLAHGLSKQETLYLIKREESTEAGDFWLKIDTAAQPVPVGTQSGDFRSDTVGLEKESQNCVERLMNEHDALTKTSLSAGESQASPRQHSSTTDAPLTDTHKTANVYQRTKGKSNELALPRGVKRTPTERSTKKNLEELAVHSCNQSSSLSKRALQLLRGARRSNNQGTAKTGLQGKPLKCGNTLRDREGDALFFAKIGADVVGPADTRGDLRCEDDSNFATLSTPTKNDLHSQVGRQQGGDEEEVDGVHIPPFGQQGNAERKSATPLAPRYGVHPLSTPDTKEGSFAVPPSPLAALFARAGVKTREDSMELLKRSSPAAGDHQAVQLPQVIITAAESDEEPISWSTGNQASQQGSSEPWTSATSAAHPGAVQKDQHEEEEQKREGVPVLKGGLQGCWQETWLQKEQQDVQFHEEETQPETELRGTQQLSFALQNMLPRLGHETDGCVLLPGLPVQQRQQQRDFVQQQRQERQLPPAARSQEGHLRGFRGKESAPGEEERSREDREVSENGAREGVSLKEADDNRLAFLLHLSLGSSGRRTSIDQKQLEGDNEDKEKKRNVGDADCKHERQEHARVDRSSFVRARTILMKSGRKKEQWPSLAAGRRKLVHAFECAGGGHHSRRQEAEGGLKIEERSHLADFVRRCHSAENPTVSGNTTAVSLHRGNTLQGPPATLARGNFFTAVQPHRPTTKADINAQTTENSFQQGSNGSHASTGKTGKATASPRSCSKKSWQEECAWLRTPPGEDAGEGCAAETLITQWQQQQHAEEEWLFFKQLEHHPFWMEEDGVHTPRAWRIEGTELEECTRNEVKTLSLPGRGNTAAEAELHAVKKGNVDSEPEMALQRLRETGRRSEAPCRVRDRATTEMVRQRLQMRGEIRATKTTSVGRCVSGARSSRVQCPKSTALRAKRDSKVRRLLRTMMRGGGHRADELAQRWLDDSGGEASGSDRSSSENKKEEARTWMQKVEKSGAPCRRNSGDQRSANASAAEEERTSQSSSGTSRGWVNIENTEEQEGDDEEQRLSEKDSFVFDMGEGVLCNTERPAEVPVKRLARVCAESNSAGGTGKATSFLSAMSFQAARRGVHSGRSGEDVGAEKSPSSSSICKRKTLRRRTDSSNVKKSDGNIDCSLHSTSLQAIPNPGGFLEMIKEGKTRQESASCTWHGERDFRRAYEDGVPPHEVGGYDKHGRKERYDAEHLKKATPARRCADRERLPVTRDSPSSSVSSREEWETLETETTFPTQQISSKCDAPGDTRVKASEIRPAENASATLGRGAFGENLGHTEERFEKRDASGDCDVKESKDSGVARACRKGETGKKGSDEEEDAGKTQSAVKKTPSVCKDPNNSKREDEAGGTHVTAILAVDPGTPRGSGTSLLSFFGTAAGWSFLKKGWKKQNEKEEKIEGEEEEAKRMQGRDGTGSKKGFSACNSGVTSLGNDTLDPVEDSSEELRGLVVTVGRPSVAERGGKSFSSVWRPIHKRRSSSSRTDVRSSNSNGEARRGSVRRRVAGCSDSPSSHRGRSSERRRCRLLDRNNSSSPRHSNSGSSLPWGGRESRSTHHHSSSKFHSTRGTVYRSLSSHTFCGTSRVHRSSSDGEGRARAGPCSGTSMRVCVASSDSAAAKAASGGQPMRQMNLHAPGELLQLCSTAVHALPASPYAPCTKRMRGRTGGSGTGARRRRSRVAADKFGKNLDFCDSRLRRGRILQKQLEKEDLACTQWKQAAGQLLRVAKHKNSKGGADAAHAHVNSDLRQSVGLWTASLGSNPCLQVGVGKGSRKNCNSNNSNELQARFHEWPSWTLRQQYATAAGGVAFQSASRLSPAFPGVYPFSPAAPHFFNTSPFSSTADTDALVGAAPVRVPAGAAPLYDTDVAAGGFTSPVYVSGAVAGCFPRFLHSASAVAPPRAAACARAAGAGARAQGASVDSEEVFGNALLPTSGCPSTASTVNRHIEPDGGCAAAAAATSPFWCRWPAAVLRVVGLPLRTVVHLLGLNVSGAYDRWRGEIRQQSLRGFLTLCLLDGVVCAAVVWGVCHLAVFATRGAFKTAYLHVHNIDAERTSHYFDGLTYRFWGKRPLYFTDNPILGAGRAADAEIATDPWSGLHYLQQRGIAWYQHHMYGDL